MNTLQASAVPTLGLFEKRLAGDDSLMALAQLRFQRARMGIEVHGGTPEEINSLLGWRPWAEAPVVVHCPRDFDLRKQHTRDRLMQLAAHTAGRVIGLVVHDNTGMVEQPDDYIRAVEQISDRLQEMSSAPTLLIEYAVGLEPEAFVNFWKRVHQAQMVAPCIDIGHVGLRAARVSFARSHHGQDICALKDQGPELPGLLAEVQKAVTCGLETVLRLIQELAPWVQNKRMHFHLHDGHPLSTFSPFGVSDHLSFFNEIPLRASIGAQWSLPLMFGNQGLESVLAVALKHVRPEQLSFTLEIHPLEDRLAIGDAPGLFNHWRDLTNAERMNHWLAMLAQNHQLLVRLLCKGFGEEC